MLILCLALFTSANTSHRLALQLQYDTAEEVKQTAYVALGTRLQRSLDCIQQHNSYNATNTTCNKQRQANRSNYRFRQRLELVLNYVCTRVEHCTAQTFTPSQRPLLYLHFCSVVTPPLRPHYHLTLASHIQTLITEQLPATAQSPLHSAMLGPISCRLYITLRPLITASPAAPITITLPSNRVGIIPREGSNCCLRRSFPQSPRSVD